MALTAQGQAMLEESPRLWQNVPRRFDSTFGSRQASELRKSFAPIASAAFAKTLQEAEER